MRVGNGYDIVLKLFGRISQHERALVTTYKKAVDPSGTLVVLYDTGDSSPYIDPLISSCSRGGTRRVQRPCELGAGVRVCRYSFGRIKTLFPLMQQRFDNISQSLIPGYARKFLFTGRNFAVEPPLVLLRMGLLDGCLDKPSRHRFIWAVEADAAFVGSNVRTFFDAFRTDSRDLLSTGFQIADTRWWAKYIHTFPSPIPRRCHTGWACFRGRDSIATLGEPLGEPLCKGAWSGPATEVLAGSQGPGTRQAREQAKEVAYYEISLKNDLKWAAGQCGTATKGGALFRLVPVERFSSQLLDHLGSLLSDGRFAASETFSSTACALEPWCSLGDWAAPNGSAVGDHVHGHGRGSFADGVLGKRRFRSPHYYYYPARFADVTSWCEACDCANAASMRNRWVHPVGELKPNLRGDHPAVWRRHQKLRAEGGSACMEGFPQCARSMCTEQR